MITKFLSLFLSLFYSSDTTVVVVAVVVVAVVIEYIVVYSSDTCIGSSRIYYIGTCLSFWGALEQ